MSFTIKALQSQQSADGLAHGFQHDGLRDGGQTQRHAPGERGIDGRHVPKGLYELVVTH